MFSKETYISRRQELKKLVKSGVIILFGNNNSPCNFPNNGYYPFRQHLNVPKRGPEQQHDDGKNGDAYAAHCFIHSGRAMHFGERQSASQLLQTAVGAYP